MNINKIVNEEVYSFLDEDYPQSFNMEEFKSLTSFRKRQAYCNEHLKYLGRGSGRRVYIIDESKVLKLAYNRKGVAQNEVEVSHSNCYVVGDLVAETYEYHPDYLWVEAERCKKITKSRFRELTGMDFEDFSEILMHQEELLSPRITPGETPELFDDAWDDEKYPFVYNMLSYLGDYNLPSGDLTRLSSYGENSKGEIVIVDYGFTFDIFKKHYSK